MENPLQLVDNTEQHQYEFSIGDPPPRIEYIISKSGLIYLTHTEVPPEMEGQGVASELVLAALRDIDRRGMKLVPMCPYVAAYIRRHPEWKRLVADGFGV
ncbi:MAG: N-acetyltransferase [Rikenellaceae bacterium]|nr:N-acetyltransferase [Rikenellaceae bacterium]